MNKNINTIMCFNVASVCKNKPFNVIFLILQRHFKTIYIAEHI